MSTIEKDSQKKPQSENFCPTCKEDWRNWLQEHHQSKQSIRLICYRQQAGVPTISWSDAVDEALCFGWIDSTRRTLDSERFEQHFSKRKPTSTWSKINKDKVEKLIAEGQMAQAGLDCIKTAKQNGSWSILDTVEALIVPEDLEAAFAAHPGAKNYFESLGKSVKKMILAWIVMAKHPATREKRITEIAENAGRQMKPNRFP